MSDAITISFWDQEVGPGFKNMKINTELFSWKVSEEHFEEVHGLSRVIRMIAHNLIVSFLIYKEIPNDPEQDKTFFIRLITDLLERYHRITISRDMRRMQNINQEAPTLEIHVSDDQLEDCLAISLPSTITMLKAVLDTIVGFINVNTEDVYWELAEEVMRITDKVREACHAYLYVAYPALIDSRRQGLDRAEVNLGERVNNLRVKLHETRNLFLEQFREEKNRQQNEG